MYVLIFLRIPLLLLLYHFLRFIDDYFHMRV